MQQSAEGEGDAISKENLVVFMLKSILQLQIVVVQQMFRYLVLEIAVTQLFMRNTQIESALLPGRPVLEIALLRINVWLHSLHETICTEL